MSTLGLLTAFLGLASAMPVREPATAEVQTNSTLVARQSSNWWLPNIDYGSDGAYGNYAPALGTSQYNNDYSYPVYISVSTAGELTAAINSNGPSTNQGLRYNGYLAAQPRVIYIAPGTYELTQTMYLYTDTILVGDAVNPPTIAASSNFQGDQLIAGGVDQDSNSGGGELKFSTMIKNVILDTTANSGTSDFTALSWRVAQNSALVNLVINLPQNAHTGISVGQGSLIQLGDTTINYGLIGVEWGISGDSYSQYGNQQGSIKNFVFNKCTTGIFFGNGNTVNVFHPTFDLVGFPIVMADGNGGWLSVIDATSTQSGNFFFTNNEYPNFMLENIRMDSADHPVVTYNDTNGNWHTWLAASTYTPTYVWGNTANANPIYQTYQSTQNIARPSALVTGSNDFYPVHMAHTYASSTVDDVINLKNPNQNGGYTVKGDGSTNDGPSLQGALNTAASQGKIAFLPFGVYITEQTLNIPIGTNLYGMGWPAISGRGSNFNDISNPQPVVTVGNAGDVGTIQIQDMRFTVDDLLPGAIILQVNAAGSNPGDVGIHNSLITVGGTPDTNINCNGYGCTSAYLGLHLTSSSSAYIDNVWAWVADHATDGSSGGTDTQAKGGVLIQATKGTWLVGLGSEHWWLYNLAYDAASNVFMSMFQSETNYHQGAGSQYDPQPPAPWQNNLVSSDPDFGWCSSGDDGCYKTINQYFSQNPSSNIFTYASGSWNFQQYGAEQDYINVESSGPTNTYEYGLTAHYANEVMLQADGTSFGNSNGYGGSWGNLVAAYVPNGN